MSGLQEDTREYIAVDTEGSEKKPWGLSFSTRVGEAFVSRTAAPAIAASAGKRIVLHNALHDIGVLRAMGWDIDLNQIEDSLLAAYLLPHLPRRLKALSFQLLGAEQNEYEDIIAPAEKKITEEYLQRVIGNHCGSCNGVGQHKVPYKADIKKFGEFEAWAGATRGDLRSRLVKCDQCSGDGTAWPLPQPQLVFDDDGTSRVYKPRSVGRRVRELLERGSGLREGWSQIDHSLRAPVEDVIGPMREATLDDVDPAVAVHYSAADADLTLGVWNKLKPRLEQNGQWRVYEIDKGIIPIIHRMHTNGILINRAHFSNIGQQFRAEQSGFANHLAALAGKSINPSSPLQVARLIYDDLGCKPIRGSRSTDDKTLQAVKAKNPRAAEAIDIIGEYRELAKLIGTYIEPLPSWADAGNRVHTRFLLHVVATGRLSSRDPNLQNIPTRSERGRLIRAGFIPRDGCRLVSVDLDQIELRVAAHISGDREMQDVFIQGTDIHRATAALIYGKRAEDITSLERLLAKTINFLILYGGGAGRLHSELALLGITTTKDQCVGYINDWFNAYPDVREYITRCQSQAKSSGYVECLFGRRRYVPGVYSCVDKVREESLKWATNFPIQATAAGILKLWMRRVWDNVIPAMASKGICEPLLTIHDELIFEAEEDMCDELIARLVQEAALAAPLSVPIKAKGLSAENWAGLKD